jgi:hypothetical protein
MVQMSGKDHQRESDSIQGSYTDYCGDPMEIRNQLSPMGQDEKEAFYWVIDKVRKDLAHRGEDVHSMQDLYDEGIDQELFYYGSHGELRVSKEANK